MKRNDGLPQLKLISHKLCPYVQRARIVLAEKHIPYELEFIDLSNKPDWFLAISPLGKVPVLLVDDEPLFESNVIAEYLDEISAESLHPADTFDKARNRSWIEFASSTLSAIAGFYNAQNEEEFENSITTLQQRFETLEGELTHEPYFNGERFSIVDAAFGPVFRYFTVFERYADFRFFSANSKTAIWARALLNRPSVQDAAVSDYAARLHCFLSNRTSFLGRLIAQNQVSV